MADKTQDCSVDQVSPDPMTSRELLNELLKAELRPDRGCAVHSENGKFVVTMMAARSALSE
jgi:hypothetical protein